MIFSYRDRKAGDVKKVMSLAVADFIQRFSWHILPKGLIKIRHYGLFSTRVKKEKLALVRKALGEAAPKEVVKLSVAEVILQTTGKDIRLCGVCQGLLVAVEEMHTSKRVAISSISSTKFFRSCLSFYEKRSTQQTYVL